MSVFSPASPADDDRGLRDTAPRRASPRVCPPTSLSCGSALLSFPPGSGGAGGRRGARRGREPGADAIAAGSHFGTGSALLAQRGFAGGGTGGRVAPSAAPRGSLLGGGRGPPRHHGAEDMPRPSTDGEMNSFRCCL